jgi:hypothetical protein
MNDDGAKTYPLGPEARGRRRLIKGETQEAFQLTPEARRHPETWPKWAQAAWGLGHRHVGGLWPEYYPDSDGTEALYLNVSDGTPIRVNIGDWLVRGQDGALHVDRRDATRR